MLFFKLFQHLHFPRFFTRRLPHLLLPLIVHHLLDHAPRFAIQVTQLAILRRDLGGVDAGRGRDDVRPPFHLVGFVKVEGDFFGGGAGGGFKGPCGFVGVDGMGEVALA